MVLIEAMLARRPVFAFAVSNIPELVFEDGPGVTGNGRLFPLPAEELPHCPDAGANGDAGDFSTTGPAARAAGGQKPYAALDRMVEAALALAADPEAAERMGEAGRRFALRFSQDVCMDRLEDILT